MEPDPARADEARRRTQAAGLGRRATVITADPRRMLYKLAGPFEVIFWSEDDPDLGDRLKSLLAPGGVLIVSEKDR